MGTTESFEFLNELALAFRRGEKHARPQHTPILEGIRAVLAHLTTANRLIPAGGMALTAEQVEDVRTVLEYAGGMPHESRIRLRRAALRLVDSVGYPNAYLVQELREALAEVDGLFPASEPAEAAGQDFLDALPTARECFSDYAPAAPAEPAEEAAPRCDAVSIYGDRCFKTSGHDDGHKAFNCTWDSTYSAPTEPAEEATKAVTWTANTTYHLEGPSETSDDKERIDHFVAAWKASGYGVTVSRVTKDDELVPECDLISSPVVPAPTETGPWQTLAEIPASVTCIKDRGHWIWTRIDADEWRCGALTQPSCLAPFVAAEEG